MALLADTDFFQRHMNRLRASLSAHSHDTICEFIVAHTHLRGRPFSFQGHEYQKEILEDKSRIKVILKSAQIGISEMSARMALAKSVLINGFSTIYTLPAASAAQNFMKTRIDPVIDTSPYLRELVSKETDNSSVKRFGDSYLYLKGAQVDRQAISVPADLLVMDEVDNSNPEVLTLYESRLIHSPFKEVVKLSTPTVPGYGIDTEYQQSRRKMQFCCCDHCNHWFYPEYYQHVKIPGFNKSLEEIVKQDFASAKFRWQEAHIACPKCGGEVELVTARRNWVVENPDDAFLASGYRVSPFDCPVVIRIPDIVKSSVDYERKQDFVNQRLGIPLADKESSITDEDLAQGYVATDPGSEFSAVMGIDMGMTCHILVGKVLPDDMVVVVHAEKVGLFDLKKRYRELKSQFRVRMSVIDHGPYTDTVYDLQQEDANLFAGIYTKMKGTELYRLDEKEGDAGKGQEHVKRVSLARNRLFDIIMARFRRGKIKKKRCELDSEWETHLKDQKRVREFVEDELVFVWQKTQGNDHFHHALLYLFVASRLIGASVSSLLGMPVVLGKVSAKKI